MTSFFDALKDMNDTSEMVRAIGAGRLSDALDAHQRMAARTQLRDIAEAARRVQQPEPTKSPANAFDRIRAREDAAHEAYMQQLEVERLRAADQDRAEHYRCPRCSTKLPNGKGCSSCLSALPHLLRTALADTRRFGQATVSHNERFLHDGHWRQRCWQIHLKDAEAYAAIKSELDVLEAKWIKSASAAARIEAIKSEIKRTFAFMRFYESHLPDFHSKRNLRLDTPYKILSFCSMVVDGLGTASPEMVNKASRYSGWEQTKQKLKSEQRESLAHFGFGDPERYCFAVALLATQARECMRIVSDQQEWASQCAAIQSVLTGERDAASDPVVAGSYAGTKPCNSGKTASPSPNDMVCPLCNAVIYTRVAKGCMQCACKFEWTGETAEIRDGVVNACLYAMCLVAAVDKSLNEKEMRTIVVQLTKRDVGIGELDLRNRIIATCKRIATVGYEKTAGGLVQELIAYKGRPLVSLVLELMEDVASADGRVGNRENQIINFFLKSLGVEVSEREQGVREARQVLADNKLITFFRAARSKSRCRAVDLINQSLDKGQSLNQIFYTGDANGFSLTVRRDGPASFNISFGCQVTEDAGDGGSWEVTFEGDAVASITSCVTWAS